MRPTKFARKKRIVHLHSLDLPCSRQQNRRHDVQKATFSIHAIPARISSAVRTDLKSPQYGHPAHVEIAAGTGPCRQCLRTFEVGKENRILFTYNPFDGIDPYPSPGPIFIHEEPCAAYASPHEFPDTLRELPLMFEGYGRDRWLVARENVRNGAAEQAIARILQQLSVDYIHVRHGQAGCFIAQINRSHAETTSSPVALDSAPKATPSQP
jgi:hypothetical protein